VTLDKTKARICVTLNLLVLPGLGTIIAGRRSGWLQAVLALAGFGLNIAWALWFFAGFLRSEELPEDVSSPVCLALAGFALFLIAWRWALASSLQILREARTTKA